MATLGGRGRGEEEPAARSAEEPVIFHKPISNFVGSKRVIKKRRMQRNLVNQVYTLTQFVFNFSLHQLKYGELVKSRGSKLAEKYLKFT